MCTHQSIICRALSIHPSSRELESSGRTTPLITRHVQKFLSPAAEALRQFILELGETMLADQFPAAAPVARGAA